MTNEEIIEWSERSIRRSKRLIAVNFATIILSLCIIAYHIVTWPR